MVVGLGGAASVGAAPMESVLVRVEPSAALPAPGSGNVLYINDCKPAGCTISPGTTDSRTNKSNIVSQPRVLQPYAGDSATWDAMVTCVRENYQDFGIEIVTTDPGNTPHYEIMVAGTATELGFPGSINGIAPFDCNVVPNGLSFAFANSVPADALYQCWVASQESAHVFGLEHSMNANDAMTYIADPPRKYFIDETACIGTGGCCQPAQECQCGRTTINSYQRLMAALGPKPPMLTFVSPADGATVPAGFTVEVATMSLGQLAKVDVYIDDVLFSRFAEPPYVLETDKSLALGSHTITAVAENTFGGAASAEITIIRGTTVQPEPEPEPEPEFDPQLRPSQGGCDAGPSGRGMWLAILVALVSIRRRRHA